MLKAFRRNEDIHLATARALWHDETIPKDSKERTMAKSINFLMSFGGGAHKIVDAFGVPLSEAKSIMKQYFTKFSALDKYFKEVGQNVKELWYIKIDPVINRVSFLPWAEEYRKCREHVQWFKACG